MIVSLNFERFATYGPEHGKKGKKNRIFVSFLRFWSGRWSFFDFICSQFLFFMTRATTLPQRVNRNSERFARYEPEKMITFLRKWYRGPKSLTAHKKKVHDFGKNWETRVFFFSLLSRSGVSIWLFCHDLKNYTQCYNLI